MKTITGLKPNKVYRIGRTRLRFIKQEEDTALFTLYGKNYDQFGYQWDGVYLPFTYDVAIDLINQNHLINN